MAKKSPERLGPEAVIEAFRVAIHADWETRRAIYRANVSPEGRNVVSLDDLRIRTEYQRMGFGTRVLALLIDLCDLNALAIKVVPAPPESDPHCTVSVTRENLIRWYEDACFRRSTKYVWIRKPRSLIKVKARS
ncbi:MAG TPA: hypothetical protein VED47_03020 [Burkholderiaceae bacterium]|nr:hypothetical protein [Burkholderiaceae bacterium]